jgi:hypothetical protein
VKLQHATIKRRPEAPLVRVFPFSIDDSESHVLIWRASLEDERARIVVAGLFNDMVRGRLRLVDQVRLPNAKAYRVITTPPPQKYPKKKNVHRTS